MLEGGNDPTGRALLNSYRDQSNSIEDAAQDLWAAIHEHLMAAARGDEPDPLLSGDDDRYIHSCLHDALMCLESANAKLDEVRRRGQGSPCPLCSDPSPTDGWTQDKEPAHVNCITAAESHSENMARDARHYAQREEK